MDLLDGLLNQLKYDVHCGCNVQKFSICGEIRQTGKCLQDKFAKRWLVGNVGRLRDYSNSLWPEASN
jgi:hypothetical protein